MANTLYPLYRQAQLEGTAPVQYLVDDIVIVAVDATYIYDDAHEFLDDVGAAVVATSAPITGKLAAGGVADADDTTLVAVTGADIVALLVVQDTGSSATSRLMVFMDTSTDSNPINIVPTGADIDIPWSNDTVQIFRL